MSTALVGLVTLSVLTVACGDKSPTAPPPAAPTITCPAARSVESPSGEAVAISWDPPVTTGGAPPVSVFCSPASGSLFPGSSTTPVTCTVTDGRGQTATCSFQVTVITPRLVTPPVFLAFGDSITAGVASEPVPGLFFLINEPYTYPNRLQDLLRARYRAQSAEVRVVNAGVSGEYASHSSATSPGGRVRFPAEVTVHQPEIVLLMEGTNDLLDESGPDAAIEALGQMVDYALGHGRRVVLATIPPQWPQAPGATPARALVAPRIPAFNQRIRGLVTSRDATRVVLADVYAAMQADPRLIGVDGLHPTESGFAVIAETFFDAVRRNFEQQPVAQTAGRLR
jgi:lysophospholipase L1-like esterase